MKNLKDTLVRALKTGVQAACASPLLVTFTSADITFLQGAAMSGFAASVAFLWNAILQWSRSGE